MIEQCFGGIDVSQDRLDVLLLPQGTGFSVANDEAGWSTLIGRLRGLLLTAIGLEPSGGYERGVLRALGGNCRWRPSWPRLGNPPSLIRSWRGSGPKVV